MKGWKTWVGAVLIAVGHTMQTIFPDLYDVGQTLQGLGVAITAVGIGHKIEKRR